MAATTRLRSRPHPALGLVAPLVGVLHPPTSGRVHSSPGTRSRWRAWLGHRVLSGHHFRHRLSGAAAQRRWVRTTGGGSTDSSDCITSRLARRRDRERHCRQRYLSARLGARTSPKYGSGDGGPHQRIHAMDHLTDELGEPRAPRPSSRITAVLARHQVGRKCPSRLAKGTRTLYQLKMCQ